MSKSLRSDKRLQLSSNLDNLASHAKQALLNWHLKSFTRQLCRQALLLMFLFPLPVLLIDLVRLIVGEVSWGLSAWSYVGLCILVALAYVLGGLLYRYLRLTVGRDSSLTLYDRQLGLSNRLTAADEFMTKSHPSGFESAAIDDAVQPVERALTAKLDPLDNSKHLIFSRWNLASIPGAVGMLFLSVWVGGLQGVTAGELEESATDDTEAVGEAVNQQVTVVGHEVSPQQPSRLAAKKAELKTEKPGQAADATVAEKSEATISQAVKPEPQPQKGSENNQQSSGKSAGAGSQTQSSVGAGMQPDQEGEEDEPKSSPKKKRVPATHKQSVIPPEENPDEPSSSSMSLEQGAASSEAAPAPSSPSSPQGGESDNPDGQDNEDGGQQETQVGSRQTPSDREGESENVEGPPPGAPSPPGDEAPGEPKPGKPADIQGGAPPPFEIPAPAFEPGPPPSDEDTELGTTGGPGGDKNSEIKERRGAPAAILGVPRPDRVKGQKGRGPEEKKVQMSQPGYESVDALSAGLRTGRHDRIGDMERAEISGWSRDVVRDYFRNLRKQVENKTTNTVDNLDKSEGEKK